MSEHLTGIDIIIASDLEITKLKFLELRELMKNSKEKTTWICQLYS